MRTNPLAALARIAKAAALPPARSHRIAHSTTTPSGGAMTQAARLSSRAPALLVGLALSLFALHLPRTAHAQLEVRPAREVAPGDFAPFPMLQQGAGATAPSSFANNATIFPPNQS